MNYKYSKELARDYNNKRRNPWDPLISFLDDIEQEYQLFNGLVMDLGCANGRNFELFKTKYLVGVDNSEEFLKIALKHKKEMEIEAELVLADMLFLPFREKNINTIICIAALHHIRGKENRKRIIKQLFEILDYPGYFILSVWRRYQKRFIKYFIRDFIKRLFSKKYAKKITTKNLLEFGDILIPWTVSASKKTYQRYYHLYSRLECKREFKPYKIKYFDKKGGVTKKDNFFIFLKKESDD